MKTTFKYVAFLSLLMLAFNVFATKPPTQQPGGDMTQITGISIKQPVTNNLKSSSYSSSWAQGGQGGQAKIGNLSSSSASEGGFAINEGNDLTFNTEPGPAAQFIYGYGSQSQDSCAASFGGGGGTGGGQGSFLFPWESDPCNARKDADKFYSWGMHLAACKRFTQESKNQQAMDGAGDSCEKWVKRVIDQREAAKRAEWKQKQDLLYTQMQAVSNAQIEYMQRKFK